MIFIQNLPKKQQLLQNLLADFSSHSISSPNKSQVDNKGFDCEVVIKIATTKYIKSRNKSSHQLQRETRSVVNNHHASTFCALFQRPPGESDPLFLPNLPPPRFPPLHTHTTQFSQSDTEPHFMLKPYDHQLFIKKKTARRISGKIHFQH